MVRSECREPTAVLWPMAFASGVNDPWPTVCGQRIQNGKFQSQTIPKFEITFIVLYSCIFFVVCY